MADPTNAENGCEPNARSRRIMSTLAEAHGWTVTTSYGDPGGRQRLNDRLYLDRPPRAAWAAEKVHPDLGKVRLIVTWQRGRFSDALIGGPQGPVATCLPSVAAVRECITHPTCGYEEVAS